MKLPISIAEKLIMLQKGEKIPLSKLKHSSILDMIDNGVLKKRGQGKSKTQIYLPNDNSLIAYLKNHFGIESLVSYIEALKKEDLSRAEAIEVSSDSKLKRIRTFKGFLVNCFEPINCILNNESITIHPKEGTFTFVYDYEYFSLPENITIVGIENPENFRQIGKQKRLFHNIEPLFVSRYPQSKDLIKWLKMIPNNYLHFGDFDFAGLNIYWNEFKKHLENRANFFLPPDIENILSSKGNRENYNNQEIQFGPNEIKELNVIILLKVIEKFKKGLEQEIFINSVQ